MKSKLFPAVLFVLIDFSTNAQVVLEQTYPNNGYFKLEITPGYGSGFAFGGHSLYMVHLEFDGDKYVDIDRMNQTLYFYNLNHSLFKTIAYSAVYTGIGNPDEDKINASLLYISQNLFDVDSAIEFMYTNYRYYYADSSWRAITQIVKENGTIMFSDSAAPIVKLNVHNQFYPVYNTANGAKMILSNVNGTAEVFSLPGTFAGCITGNNILNSDRIAEMNLFPNPVNRPGFLTISYILPYDIKTATLIIVDEQGKQIKTLQIGNAMNNVLLNISEFSSGTYFYSILSGDGRIIQSKKSIVLE